MPTMSGAIGWMDRMNSNNRKPPPASCTEIRKPPPASCTEIHSALAEMDTKLIEMPVFVCFLCAEWVFFVLKYGQK